MVFSEAAALLWSLWVNKIAVIATITMIYAALFLRRALRDGYFDTVPTLNVFIGRGETSSDRGKRTEGKGVLGSAAARPSRRSCIRRFCRIAYLVAATAASCAPLRGRVPICGPPLSMHEEVTPSTSLPKSAGLPVGPTGPFACTAAKPTWAASEAVVPGCPWSFDQAWGSDVSDEGASALARPRSSGLPSHPCRHAAQPRARTPTRAPRSRRRYRRAWSPATTPRTAPSWAACPP